MAHHLGGADASRYRVTRKKQQVKNENMWRAWAPELSTPCHPPNPPSPNPQPNPHTQPANPHNPASSSAGRASHHAVATRPSAPPTSTHPRLRASRVHRRRAAASRRAAPAWRRRPAACQRQLRGSSCSPEPHSAHHRRLPQAAGRVARLCLRRVRAAPPLQIAGRHRRSREASAAAADSSSPRAGVAPAKRTAQCAQCAMLNVPCQAPHSSAGSVRFRPTRQSDAVIVESRH